MGLDVSLYKCPVKQRKIEQEKENEYNVQSEKNWQEQLAGRSFDELPENEKEIVRQKNKELAESLGLGKHGESIVRETIEINSSMYPDHMFKIGYLRSSYNSCGINSVLRELGIPDLYDIFQVKDGYYVEVDWNEALVIVESSIEAFKEFMTSQEAKYTVVDVPLLSPDSEIPQTTKDTLAVFMKQLENHPPRDDQEWGRSYSCKEGNFWLDGLTIRGVRYLPKGGRLGSASIHLVVDATDSQWDWYLKALEITKEMIEYVLLEEWSDDFFLGWSS